MSSSEREAPTPLSAAALCWRCLPEHFTFETTDDLEDLGEVIGQERAIEAIRFAVGMRRPGYNLYALGPEGTGKHTEGRRSSSGLGRQGLRPSVYAPGSIESSLWVILPMTRAVLVTATLVAITGPLTDPWMQTDSAKMLPSTRPLSPTVTRRLRIVPSTVPCTSISP